ncbi:MAG TPA: DUF3108 domain-containing protein [Thermoanaerobaculia bacterium]
MILALLAAAQIATTTPAPIEETFLNGETLDYTLTWMKVTGGTARMTIAPSEDKKNAFRITSFARSGGGLGRLVKVRDHIETTVARNDFSTLRITKDLNERGNKLKETTVIEDGVATRKRKHYRKLPVPRPVLDPISVIYHLRTLDLTPGKSYDFTLYADLKLYDVHAKVVRREVVQTPAGNFNCVLIEPEMRNAGVMREERLFIWYSDDERRLPVRIRTEVKFGSVTATLHGVQSGVTSIEAPALTAAVAPPARR